MCYVLRDYTSNTYTSLTIQNNTCFDQTHFKDNPRSISKHVLLLNYSLHTISANKLGPMINHGVVP